MPIDNPLVITSTGTVSSTGASQDGIDAAATNAWTITNAGLVRASAGNAIALAGVGTVANSGSLSGVDGIVLSVGGSVSNGAGASITATGSIGHGGGFGSAIYIKGTSGSVTNAGMILGPGYGVGMTFGGTVTNTAMITGGEDGVIIQGALGSMTNSGSIIGTVDDGASFFAGGTMVNNTGGFISGAGTAGSGIFITGGVGSLANYGTVKGDNNKGILFTAGGEILNGTTGAISGLGTAVFFSNTAGTLGNSGSITTTATAGTGVDMEGGGVVANSSSGVITGGASYGGDGIFVTGGAAAITNYGQITGFHGIEVAAGGSLTNQSGAVIAGGREGVAASNAPLAISNAGSIVGTTDAGIYFQAGGSVSNTSPGSISGYSFGIFINHGSGTVSNSGSVSGHHGIGLEAGGSITNAGGTISGVSSGIFSNGAAITLTNSGNLSATNGAGADIEAGGSVTNNASATISGSSFGIFLSGGAGTVDNAGTISGGSYAIDFGSNVGNRLIVQPGAVFSGGAYGGGGTLELAGAGGAIGGIGTVTGFGHFQSLAVDTGADWTLVGGNSIANLVSTGTLGVAGTLDVSATIDPSSTGSFMIEQNAILEVAAAVESTTPIDFFSSGDLVVDNASLFGLNVGTSSYAGPQLQNFGINDVIDLKSFGSSGATDNYDPTSGLLQLFNGSQTASLSFQTSTLGSGTFNLASDGATGLLIMHS
jgi:hypothetical protein